MTFRMLRYAVAVMQRHFEQHKALPLMILMLFYHGERSPYSYSMSWLDCFENSALAAKTCTELFHLVDMTVMGGDEIMQYRKQSFSLLCYPLDLPLYFQTPGIT